MQGREVNTVSRRTFVRTSLLAVPAMHPLLQGSGQRQLGKRMGVTAAAYALRRYRSLESDKYPPFTDALKFINHCAEVGAGGVQLGVRDWTPEFARRVKERIEELDFYFEGSIGLPKSESDVDRFERDVQFAMTAGAKVIRTVCLSGRRYETFHSKEAFEAFRKESMQSLALAEAVLRRYRVKLAVENHKDWRIEEMLKIMRHFESEWITVTLDTGNNLSLLDDPMEVVEALAPYATSLHLKDMAYEEYEDGFLLSEVPLGTGSLDLARIIDLCEQANAAVTYNLEMITRDPLKIPCLTKEYWSTMESVTGKELAYMLQKVRRYQLSEPLPRISGKSNDRMLAFEEENVVRSFAFAQEKLGFS